MRTLFSLVTVTLLVLLPGIAGAAPAEARPLDAATRDFDQLHLDLHVVPDLARGTVEGRVRLRFASLVDGLHALRLHCVETQVRSVKDPGGRELEHAVAGGVLRIDLPGPLAEGAQSEVTIRYESRPTRGLYFHRPTESHPDTPWFLYSQGQGTDNRRWIPCYDEPDDRCSWNLTVQVPADLQTVSNGVLAATSDLETAPRLREDRWSFDGRAPTYLISLVVAPLETITKQHGAVQLDFSAVPGHREELETSLAETGAMLDFFGEYLQSAYPWKRYAQTYVWDFIYGGMENVTATTLNMRALHTQAIRPNYRSEGLVAHELAHMWFGDLLTCRTWEHIWLNEGFATYFTDLFFERRYGEDEFLLRRRDQNRSYMAGTPIASELKLERDPRGDVPLELFGGKQYSRGAAILHNLRRHVGDEVFRDAIRLYVRRHRDETVTSEDLRTITEEVAGQDLRWFWDQWVYGLGYPKFDVRVDRDSKTLVVRQVQKTAGGQGLFRLRVPVRFGKGGAVQTYTLYKERHTFPLSEANASAYVRFGVGGDLLMTADVHQDWGAWGEQLLTDPDVTARLDAAEALEEFGEVSVPPLHQALTQDDAYAVRKKAAEVLGRLEGARAGAALLEGARDADSRVREAVLHALAGQTRALAGAVVRQAAREEAHPSVRAAAARALGRLKVEGAFEALTALLAVDSDQEVVRTGAVDGLKSLADTRAVDAVMPFVDYSWGHGANHVLRQAAIACITALQPDDREVHALLVDLLDDPYHRMRSWAAEACGKYKVTPAIPRLRHVRDEDWNGGVKGAARKALERLGWKDPPAAKQPEGKAKKAG